MVGFGPIVRTWSAASPSKAPLAAVRVLATLRSGPRSFGYDKVTFGSQALQLHRLSRSVQTTMLCVTLPAHQTWGTSHMKLANIVAGAAVVGMVTAISMSPSLAHAEPPILTGAFAGCYDVVIDQSGLGSRASLQCGGIANATQFRTVGPGGSGSYVYGPWVRHNYSTSKPSRCYTGFQAVYYQKR